MCQYKALIERNPFSVFSDTLYLLHILCSESIANSSFYVTKGNVYRLTLISQQNAVLYGLKIQTGRIFEYMFCS